jgi:hypothetical protein
MCVFAKSALSWKHVVSPGPLFVLETRGLTDPVLAPTDRISAENPEQIREYSAFSTADDWSQALRAHERAKTVRSFLASGEE